MKLEMIGGEYQDAEWFHQCSLDTAHGVCATKSGEWLVLKRVLLDDYKLHTWQLARVPTREVAVGFLKLLKGN